MNSMMPVWQLPVRERVLAGKPNRIHPLAKFHFFVGGKLYNLLNENDLSFFYQVQKNLYRM